MRLRSIDSKSLVVLSRLFPAHPILKDVEIPTLVDCGCTPRGFCDTSFVKKHQIRVRRTPYPRKLLLGDGREAAEKVEWYFIAPIAIGNHQELCLFFVTSLGPDTPVILGMPWLQQHNPDIDWLNLSVVFSSDYCKTYCIPPWLDNRAPTIPLPHRNFPDPVPAQSQLRSSSYQPPSVEDYDEDNDDMTAPARATKTVHFNPTVEAFPELPQIQHCTNDAPELPIQLTLSPGTCPFRTRAVDAIQETRAMMIPSTPSRVRLEKAPMVAGQRRRGKPLSKEHLQCLVPLPENHCDEQTPNGRPDLTDIKMLGALPFARFSQSPGVTVAKVTWDELDMAARPRPAPVPIPTIPDTILRNALLGQGDKQDAIAATPPELHDFIDECYQPLRLSKITEADIAKFMKGKPEITTEEMLKRLPTWLHDKAEAFSPKAANVLPPQRSWDHKIDIMPGKEPPYQKTRPMSPDELKVVRKWLDDNLEKGFVRESRARCAAPLLLAAKPGGGIRICQDYRGLNSVTIKNRYPLPLIRETLDAICRAKIYTKLDIIAAFNKIRIAEHDVWKTAFITRFGLFETLVMPFGLCNAPATFQHYINHALFDILDKFCTAYLDDVLIYSESKGAHRAQVREVVDRLAKAGLHIDINKCEFETTKTRYLGLIITPGGIEMDPEKVLAIRDWAVPPGLRDLQRFLGFANFYRRFIQNFSGICRPLNDLLRKETKWHWDEPQEKAFQELKRAFVSAPVLAMFDYNRKTVLETDASDWASGGVLSQYDDEGVLRPVAYFSAKHSAAECNYEIYDKELLAIIKCMEEWRPELQGTQDAFDILTDHKNLEYFTTTKSLNQRQVRWSEFLSGFNFRIVYRPGPKAVRPDALSRKSEDRPDRANAEDDRIKNRERVVLPPGRFARFALETQICELFAETIQPDDLLALPLETVLPDDSAPLDDLIARAYGTSPLIQVMRDALAKPMTRRWPKEIRKELSMAMADCKLVGDRIYFRNKLFLPPDDELKIQVIRRYHSSGPGGHPGRFKTVDLIARDFWWPRLTRDVQAYVRACDLCVRTKASRSSPSGFLRPLPVPFRAWSDISVDYITPLPDCERDGAVYKHIAVVVCRLTKMRHFIATKTLSAEELADRFLTRVYSLHGAPETIVSDRGTQFVSEFWRELSARLGITLRHSSAYHPETDGQTERINAILEAYLRGFMNFAQNDWVDWLPLAEFASNNATSETTGVSPFFANYGFNPRLGFEPRSPCSPDKTPQQKKEFLKASSIADRFDRILTQLKALAADAARRYEENANTRRSDAPVYEVGQRVWLNTRHMRTNRPMKKGDDKWSGPFKVTAVYPRACALALTEDMKVFPVFHTSLLQPYNEDRRFPTQDKINEAESRHLRGRILEREDGTEELVAKWEFETLLDCHNEDGLQYLIKWRYHKPTWQPAADLKGQDKALWDFHRANPDKPGPPRWLKKERSLSPPATAAAAPRRSPRLRKVAFACTQQLKEVTRWMQPLSTDDRLLQKVRRLETSDMKKGLRAWS